MYDFKIWNVFKIFTRFDQGQSEVSNVRKTNEATYQQGVRTIQGVVRIARVGRAPGITGAYCTGLSCSATNDKRVRWRVEEE